MKKANIAFSGVMAAILVSAGAANAATEIASKSYVDKRESAILESVADTYETKENVQLIQQTVTELGDTINNQDTGLAAQVKDAVDAASAAQTAAEEAKNTATGAQGAVDALEGVVGNEESGLVKDVNDLGTTVGTLETTVSGLDTELDSKLDASTAASTYEVLTNKADAINAGNQTSTDAYPSIKAVVEWTGAQISGLEDTGIPVNPDNITPGSITGDKLKDGTITGDKIADDTITTDNIADGTISSGDLDTALNAKIDGKEDKSNKIQEITAESTSDQYPSAVAVRTALSSKADASALDAIEESVTNVTNQYKTINETVTELGDTINNQETGLTQQITNITQQIGSAETGGLAKDIADAAAAAAAAQGTADAAQDAVDALEGVVDGKANASTTLAGYGITDAYTKAQTDGLLDDKADVSALSAKEDTANKTKVIDDMNKSSETLFPTIGAITTWTDQQIQQLSTDGIPVNPDNIGPNAITTEKIANGAVTTEKIQDNAVTEDKLSDDLVSVINGALPAPTADCVADSNLCVLSVTPEGDLAWVAVTQPAE